LLKIASPGVPDTYQGTEIWDFSLVDPDNRRPVDYTCRSRMLQQLQTSVAAAGEDRRALVQKLLRTKEDGSIKLYITWLALNCRRTHPGLFSVGDYLPTQAIGAEWEHVFAFARCRGADAAIGVAPGCSPGCCRRSRIAAQGSGVAGIPESS
jgi:(1->4)-alpha-D-glucan 1-alpha-D-glucosylmutase